MGPPHAAPSRTSNGYEMSIDAAQQPSKSQHASNRYMQVTAVNLLITIVCDHFPQGCKYVNIFYLLGRVDLSGLFRAARGPPYEDTHTQRLVCKH